MNIEKREKIIEACSEKFVEPYMSMAKDAISELLKDFENEKIAQMQEFLFFKNEENVSLSDVRKC